MLFGVFADPDAADPRLAAFWLNLLLGGAIIGGAIGYFVVSVEALRDRSLLRFVRLATYGVLLGGLGRRPRHDPRRVGQRLAGLRLRRRPRHRVSRSRLRSGLGWMFSARPSASARAWPPVRWASSATARLGGTLGGFIGGAFFGRASLLSSTRDLGAGAALSGAVGLVILGAASACRPWFRASSSPLRVKVMHGWQEGREYPLEKVDNFLGRDEHADIALFRDMKVEKRHAVIRREGDVYVLVNKDSPANGRAQRRADGRQPRPA